MNRIFYVSTCPETGRQFLCEEGIDNNVCEITPDLLAVAHGVAKQNDPGQIRDALQAAADYLGSLTKDDGTDDDHPARSPFTDVCAALDLIGWRNPPLRLGSVPPPRRW